MPLTGYAGKSLRLIVVGINSFNGATPHVVFQFQNIPVERWMNAADTYAGGYRDSEMRAYVKGNFLEGRRVLEGALGRQRGFSV